MTTIHRNLTEEIVRCYNNRIDFFINFKDYAGAIGDYKKIIELENKNSNPHIHFKIGVCFENLNRLEDAIEYFNLAIKEDDQVALYYYRKGVVLQKMKRYEDVAITCFKKAIELNIIDEDIYFLIAESYKNLNRYDDAISNYKLSIDSNKNKEICYYNIGIIYFELKDYKKAIENFDKAIELDIKDRYVYYYIANAKNALGDLEGYINDIRQFHNLKNN